MQDVTKRRGRPPAYERRTALGAIRDVFWDHGYSATSLEAIAEAAGMNRPSLYAAFGDKRSMYLEAFEAATAELAPALGEALRRPGLQAALAAFFDAAIRAYLEGAGGPRGCFVVCTATVEMLKDAEVRDRVRGAIEATEKAIEARVQKAVTAGEVRPGIEPAIVAAMATALLHSIAVRARAGVGEEELRSLIDKSLDRLLA